MIPILYTLGSLIITALTKEMAKEITHWFHDQEVTKHNSHGILAQKVPTFESIDPNNQIIWAVNILAGEGHIGGTHIGNVMLEIDWLNRKAEFSCIFGEKKHWGKGYATKAIRQLFEHGFNKLNLNKIWLGTPYTNHGMLAIARKLEMEQEGVLVNDMFLEGDYVDVIRFAIFKGELK